MKLYKPTASYQLHLPDEIESEHGGRSASFWFDGKSLLLQLSSSIRTEGEQVKARQRLQGRLVKSPGTQRRHRATLNKNAPDQAAAEVVDANGTYWLHVYLVRPHLAIYASISGPAEEVRDAESWARSALMGLDIRPEATGKIQNDLTGPSLCGSEAHSTYEKIFAIFDYFNGPRTGVANYRGNPHLYECVFDEKADEYSDTYLLMPIDPETLRAALLTQQIFLRWNEAFHAGRATRESHPSLADDRPRYEHAKQILESAIARQRDHAIRARGSFEMVGKLDFKKDMSEQWRVSWIDGPS